MTEFDSRISAPSEDDLNDAARYVAANPVRAGLVSNWAEYPYSGGVLLDGASGGDLKVAATPASWPDLTGQAGKAPL